MKSFRQFLAESEDYPISETPERKKRRETGGYNTLVRIDAKKFKEHFEKTHNEPLDWNQRRLDNLRKLGHSSTRIDAHPEIGSDSFGKVTVDDGRHRISHAAELGQHITVAVHDDHLKNFEKQKHHFV